MPDGFSGSAPRAEPQRHSPRPQPLASEAGPPRHRDCGRHPRRPLPSASSLEALRFSPAAIIAFRLAAFLVFGMLAYIGLFRPLQRRVTDSQVAMPRGVRSDAAGRHPQRHRILVGARQPDRNRPLAAPGRAAGRAGDRRCRAIEDGMAIERPKLRRQAPRSERSWDRGAHPRLRAGLPQAWPVGAAHRRP